MLGRNYVFFDNAATTRCCDPAAALIQQFATEDFGNPSSSHAYGKKASQAIAEARKFFAQTFKVEPNQVIFTGSGTEADNLAVYGIALQAKLTAKGPTKVITTSIEHPAVKTTVRSLSDFGIETEFLSITHDAQIDEAALKKAITPTTALVSIQHVNNIVGSVLKVEELAKLTKAINPSTIFHTDSVQAFGKVAHPTSDSQIDLVSISGHKVHGPKGIGALIVLNKNLLKGGLRPLVWGGEQEGGFRSGTQNAGLIAGFHAAAQHTLENRAKNVAQVQKLNSYFKEALLSKGLIHTDPKKSLLHWNSPSQSVPHIVNLSLLQVAPGKSSAVLPAGLLAQMLDERGCLVSTGSACSSKKREPDAVLAAMGLSPEICGTALRISFSSENTLDEINLLVQTLGDSIQQMAMLFS